jgi:DinB superfamily
VNGRVEAISLGLAALPEIVLAPLAGRPEADWQRAPAGKWTPAQIVEHLALGLEWSGRKFTERRAKGPMSRRRRTPLEWLTTLLLMKVRWYPTGMTAPEGTRPAPRVEGAAAEARFRSALAIWDRVAAELLPARRRDLFVKHPRLGDLTIEEWVTFHVGHARHHARQIRERLAG